MLQSENLKIAGKQASCRATDGALISAAFGALTMGEKLSTI
jgi:hypothetical protein